MQWKFFLKKVPNQEFTMGKADEKKKGKKKFCARVQLYFSSLFSARGTNGSHLSHDPLRIFHHHSPLFHVWSSWSFREKLKWMDQKPQAILYQVRKWGYFMRVLRGRWEFSPLLITRVISTSRCSSLAFCRYRRRWVLESVPDPNLSSWIFNWCYANNTPNLYTELFKAPYKPTVPNKHSGTKVLIFKTKTFS